MQEGKEPAPTTQSLKRKADGDSAPVPTRAPLAQSTQHQQQQQQQAPPQIVLPQSRRKPSAAAMRCVNKFREGKYFKYMVKGSKGKLDRETVMNYILGSLLYMKAGTFTKSNMLRLEWEMKDKPEYNKGELYRQALSKGRAAVGLPPLGSMSWDTKDGKGVYVGTKNQNESVKRYRADEPLAESSSQAAVSMVLLSRPVGVGVRSTLVAGERLRLLRIWEV